MRWSWRIGAFRGIEVFIHATFLILVGWIFLAHLMRGEGIGAALSGVAFISLLFLCVVLHEFGHALTAQRFGIRTRDITLYPIGGVARLERIPREPNQELLIALAGPAVNVVIAAGLFLYLSAVHALSGFGRVELVGGDLLSKLMWVNVTLVAFNMLPAFPMDGGRVLRAFLAKRMDYGKATQTAANIGQAMAFLFGLMGLLSNPFLLFIAFFVFLGATQEAALVQTELAFRGVPVRGAMMTRFHALAPTDPLSRATDLLLAGPQPDFPVIQDGAVVGVLTRDALIQALSQCGPGCEVSQAMRPAPEPVSPDASLEETFQRIRGGEVQTVPVIEAGQLVGLITLENIGEFLMVRNALEQLPPGTLNPEVEAIIGNGETRTRRPHWMPGRPRARS